MNVLITGATGFIGQHLLEELAGDDLNITVISRQLNPTFWCSNKKFKVIQANISDKISLKEALTNIDAVINIAAELKSNEKFESTNILGTQNLVQLSRENNVKKIIHLSSVGVVGMQYSIKHVAVDENTPCHPQNGYERTKLKSEEIIKSSKIPYVILRPTNVFGDHHPRKALLGFFQRIKAQKTFPMTKNALANYVYVKDVAHAMRFAILNNIENKVINVGETTSLKNFIEMAARELSVGYKITYLSSILFSAIETFTLGRFGKLRGISNCVEYKDEFMKGQIKYKYGNSSGIKKTLSYYFKKDS